MGTRIGYVGSNSPGSYTTKFKTPQSLDIQLDSGEYPDGSFTLNDISIGSAYWYNEYNDNGLYVNLFLCDSNGNNRVQLGYWRIESQTSDYTKTFTVRNATGLTGKALYLLMEDTVSGSYMDSRDYTVLRYRTDVTVSTIKNTYAITCESTTGGNLTANYSQAAAGTTVTLTPAPETGYQLTGYTTTPSVTITGNQFVMPSSAVTIRANFAKVNYTITKAASPSAGGTLTVASTAQYNTVVSLSVTPATGYRFTGYTTSPSLTITDNKFTMPPSNVSITANFEKITYTITKAASPTAGGTVTVASTAQCGDSVSISQTPNTGYYFNGWQTSPALTISGGAFTMPANNVSVTAKYLKRSTATLSKTSMTGGDTITLTISTESSAYTHKYKLSFGTNMETSLTNVSAGVTSVSISVPASWSNYIPSATSKSGGSLVLYTYSGSTQIGSYTISSLTYNVPSSAVPTIGTVTTSIARTIGGVTYANVGNYYVQNHSGVRVQTTAAGVYSSTISSLKVSINGYSGNSYTKTVSSGSIDFTTGLLSVAGTTTITVTATDSRGRKATKTATITVTAYNAPSGTVTCRRVDSGGSDDDMGQYAKYTMTKTYSAIGSNTLTTRMTSQGSTVTITNNSGDVLPGSRQTFDIQLDYTVTVTLQDNFETTTVTGKLQSARFIIFASANGKKLGLMKAATKGGTNDETIELSGTATIYIGDLTLAQYIQQVVNNM